jgi:hypothetical protein
MSDVLVDLFTNVIIMPPLGDTRYDSIDDAEVCCLELDDACSGCGLLGGARVSSRGRGRRITFPRRVKQQYPPEQMGYALKSLDHD